jgi:hypothetical protein
MKLNEIYTDKNGSTYEVSGYFLKALNENYKHITADFDLNLTGYFPQASLTNVNLSPLVLYIREEFYVSYFEFGRWSVSSYKYASVNDFKVQTGFLGSCHLLTM